MVKPQTPPERGIVQGREVKRLRYKLGDWLEIQFTDNQKTSICKWAEFKPQRPAAPKPRPTREVLAYPVRLSLPLDNAPQVKVGTLWYATASETPPPGPHMEPDKFNLWKCTQQAGKITPTGLLIMSVNRRKLSFLAPALPLHLPQ